MTIVVTGGGSGGHITPILAVANQLKRLRPDIQVIYIGQKGDKLADIPAADPAIDKVYVVRAGKFRRYHGRGWKQLLDLKTQFLNARDAIFVVIGLWQSFWLLRRLKPEIIFTRGGFVSVPVALGGKLNGIPFITHDSDSIPSLANRMIARWASVHAVALPADAYPYPQNRTVTVGVPVSTDYTQITPALQQAYRKQLELEQYMQIVLVTGGGNGATRLNTIVVANSADLLKSYPKLAIVHLTGRGMEDTVKQAYAAVLTSEQLNRIVLKPFVTDLYRYSGAADIVIGRGGATNLAEFALQGKACIIIPASQLLWAIKNTEALAARKAIVYLTEAQAEQERRLAFIVRDLLDNAAQRQQLGRILAEFAVPDAANKLARLLLELATSKKVDYEASTQ